MLCVGFGLGGVDMGDHCIPHPSMAVRPRMAVRGQSAWWSLACLKSACGHLSSAEIIGPEHIHIFPSFIMLLHI